MSTYPWLTSLHHLCSALRLRPSVESPTSKTSMIPCSTSALTSARASRRLWYRLLYSQHPLTRRPRSKASRRITRSHPHAKQVCTLDQHTRSTQRRQAYLRVTQSTPRAHTRQISPSVALRTRTLTRTGRLPATRAHRHGKRLRSDLFYHPPRHARLASGAPTRATRLIQTVTRNGEIVTKS